MELRFITAGESHGPGLTGIIEGIPAGLVLSEDAIAGQLKRRQQGHGRGGRMKIETDRASILSGVRWGKTLGGPITLHIENRDWKNWSEGMSPDAVHEGSIDPVTRPRPGHADLTGALKYGHRDVRNILERSSARETAMRVALGAVAKEFLAAFGVKFGCFITDIGSVSMDTRSYADADELLSLAQKAEDSPVRCPDEAVSAEMVKLIDKAKEEGNTLGGVFVVFAVGLPPGLGSHVQWDRKLDGRLAQALMSIQAIKGVEVGMGMEAGRRPGSEVMDEIHADKATADNPVPFPRTGNNAGGIEGGMTNGMPLVVRAAMKPIPTLRKPLKSIDLATGEPFEAAYERSDVCASPAAAVIGEAMAALVVAGAFLEKFGGDSMEETRRNYDGYMASLREF
jgi:chorismate synthase